MIEKRKILITGGCGFVGRHLISRLCRDSNVELWVIDNLSTGRHPAEWCLIEEVTNSVTASLDSRQDVGMATRFHMPGENNSLVFLQIDFMSVALSELDRQPKNLSFKLPQFEEIYHLASVVGGRAVIEGDPLLVGIDLAIDSVFFLWAANVNRPGRILYTSSSAAYPTVMQQTDESVILKEEFIEFGVGLSQPDFTYGWSKLTGEYLAGIAVAKYGLKVAVVRPFSGYGEDQDPSYPVPAIALRVAERHAPVRVWGSGLQGRDFVHIDDCVEACVLVCRHVDDGSAYNIGSGKLTTFNDIARMLISIEGYAAIVEGTDNRPVGVRARYGDPTKLKAALGWQPKIPLVQGLEQVLKGAKARIAHGINASP